MSGELLIIGVLVSAVAEYFKSEFDFSEYGTLAFVALISVLGAGVYNLAKFYGFLPALMQVLTTAGAFYTFIIKRFKK